MRYKDIESINNYDNGTRMLKMRIICSDCGSGVIDSGDKYCRHCGHKLDTLPQFVPQHKVIELINCNRGKLTETGGEYKPKENEDDIGSFSGTHDIGVTVTCNEKSEECKRANIATDDASLVGESSSRKLMDDDEVLFVDDATGKEYSLLNYPGHAEGHYDPVAHPCLIAHIRTKNLCDHQADFYVRIADLDKDAKLPKGKWCDKDDKFYAKKMNGVTDDTDECDESAWNGHKSTENMISGKSEIAINVKKETCKVRNGTPLTPFIGTVLQYKELWSKKTLLNNALTFFHLESAMDGYCLYWTSTQLALSAYGAWNWYASTQAWSYGNYKSSTSVCVPFFTI